MPYSIEILRSAQKQLAKIERKDQERIIVAIQALSDNPEPTGSKKLSGRDAWRIRIGTFRVIYEINDSKIVLIVIAIGHRKDIYRK